MTEGRVRASASVQLHAHAAIGGAAVGAVFGNRLVARVGDVIDAAVDRQAIPDRQFGADAGQRIAVDAHAAAVAVTVEAVADDLHGATDTQTEGQAIVDDERRGFLGPAQQIGAEGGAGRAVFRIDVRHVGRHGQRVDGAQADRELHALGMGALDVVVDAERAVDADRTAGVLLGARAAAEADLVARVAVEIGRRDAGATVEQRLFDAGIPVARGFRIEACVPVRAVQLVQGRRLEALAIARPQRRAGAQRQRGVGAESGVIAERLMVVVADAAGQGQCVERLHDRFAIDAGDADRAAQRRVAVAAVFMLDAGDDADLIDRLIIALIFVAFRAAAERRRGGAGLGIGVAVDVGDGEGDAVAERAEVRVQAGIAVQFVRGREAGVVGKDVVGRRIAVGLRLAVGPIAAQVEANAVGEVDAQAAGRAVLAIAVALGAVGRGRDAVAAQIAAGQCARDRAAATRDAALRVKAVGIAIFGAGARLQPLGRFFAAAGRRGIVDAHAVDHDQSLLRLCAAQAHAGEAAQAAIARHGDAGGGRQQIGDRHGLAAIDLVAGDDGHGLADFGSGLGDAAGRASTATDGQRKRIGEQSLGTPLMTARDGSRAAAFLTARDHSRTADVARIEGVPSSARHTPSARRIDGERQVSWLPGRRLCPRLPRSVADPVARWGPACRSQLRGQRRIRASRCASRLPF
ncbi:hypothetical protein WR25_09723 [Diploscapter pachys]|uniref:Uncharacterized protein n=1 Tax=Diploscapter pachys TaxID=2018661 RepID=A0A2A2KJX8_9BILA|nr:hypothetical protein WR25_09723 [Diploscapter pachys]